MLLVIGQFPDRHNSRDGMVQRIAALDGYLAVHERVYVTLVHEPFRGWAPTLEQVGPRVRRVRLNWFDATHVDRLAELARGAACVVVHSVHWAQHVMPLYRALPVVTDLHGVVPEEQAYTGSPAAAEHLGRVESFVMRHGYRQLVVSDAMGAHLQAKYPGVAPRLITLPVTSPAAAAASRPADKRAREMRVIYSGGTHAWQNIDRMLDAIAQGRPELPVDLLTPDVEEMRARAARRGLLGRVTVRSVAPERMAAEYARAHLGFVLRDDHVVNRAACPTKLQEYLAHGVVPIVLSPHIGDFATLGYRTVALEAYTTGGLPTWESWRQMAEHNLGVLDALRTQAAGGAQRLADAVGRPARSPDAEARVEEELVAARLLAERMAPSRRRTRHLPHSLLRRLLP